MPKLGSLILTHDWNGEVKGLKAWPRAERPNAPIVFWSFRIMVGIGVLMVLLGAVEPVAALARRLYDSGLLLRLAVLMGPSGFVAVLAGWITTEVGRQPYTVYGLLRTAQSVSPIDAQAVGASLRGLHRRLLRRVRRRHVLHPAPDGASTPEHRRARHRDGRADPRRRHHAGAGAGAAAARAGG